MARAAAAVAAPHWRSTSWSALGRRVTWASSGESPRQPRACGAIMARRIPEPPRPNGPAHRPQKSHCPRGRATPHSRPTTPPGRKTGCQGACRRWNNAGSPRWTNSGRSTPSGHGCSRQGQRLPVLVLQAAFAAVADAPMRQPTRAGARTAVRQHGESSVEDPHDAALPAQLGRIHAASDVAMRKHRFLHGAPRAPKPADPQHAGPAKPDRASLQGPGFQLSPHPPGSGQVVPGFIALTAGGAEMPTPPAPTRASSSSMLTM